MSGIDHLLQASRKLEPSRSASVPHCRCRQVLPAARLLSLCRGHGAALPAALPLQLLRKQQAEGGRPGGSPATAAAQQHRFLATKLSWRGSYRRLVCITPTHLLTLYPDTLAVTNSWAYAGDHDLAGVEVGGEHGADGGVFTLHFRRDKKVGGHAGARRS